MVTLHPSRQIAVDKAREGRIRRLIDLSRRNNLLYYRNLKTGTLDLTNADQRALDNLLVGRTVSLSQLLPDADETRTAAVAREIFRRAQTNLKKKGLETLFLALGMATWAPSDEGRPPEAAVLLLPVAIEIKGFGRSISLKRAGEIVLNLVLLHVLDVEYGQKLDADELLEAAQPDDDDERFDPEVVFDAFRSVVAKVPPPAMRWSGSPMRATCRPVQTGWRRQRSPWRRSPRLRNSFATKATRTGRGAIPDREVGI